MAATSPPPTLCEIIALAHQLLPSPSLPIHLNAPRNAIHNAHEFGSPSGSGSASEQEDEGDHLLACGIPALHLLHHHPDAALKFGYEKLHMVPYREVKTCWRRYYTDAALKKVLGILEKVVEEEVARDRDGKSWVGREGEMEERGEEEEGEDWITQVVKTLDMALILTAAPGREELIELIFSALETVIAESENKELDDHEDKDNLQRGQHESDLGHRPCKRRKLNPTQLRPTPNIQPSFPTEIPARHLPHLRHPIPRLPCSSLYLSSFQSRISEPTTSVPFIITGVIDFWPALSERPWNSPAYLLERTLGGRRLVPVEVGRSYTDEGWGQRVMGLGEFLGEFMLEDVDEGGVEMKRKRKKEKGRPTGYLAQHDLFAQIPSLRADISIPDYCYVDLPPPPPPPPPSSKPPVEKLSTPLLNAWFGPAGTISPLHTDPYHNILAQVVGSKYIRLYGPSENESMYPRGKDERGVDMANTSQVDLDIAMGVWKGIGCWPGAAMAEEEGRREDEGEEPPMTVEEDMEAHYERNFPLFKTAAYVDCVLGPGECLYIPPGWWHYVRSLTPSFSVSFWFN